MSGARTPAHGMSLGPARNLSSSPDRPITTRAIHLIRAAGSVEIGELIHRGYDSGYPQPYEVWVHGSGAFDYYPDSAAAEAGAAVFAAAAYRVVRGEKFWSLGDVERPYALAHPACPTCGHPLPAPTPPGGPR